MKKRDFIQQASIQFMPQTDWNLDKSIQYAEKLWLKLDRKGYGDSQPSQPRDMINYYQQLSVTAKQQFDQFWIAFDYKHGKQRAAMRWGQLEKFSPTDLKNVIASAKQTAAARKNLKPDQTPIMAEGWLSQMRFDDYQETSTEKNQKKQNQAAQKIREITGALNHAKNMQQSCSDETWNTEVTRLTEDLKKLRV